MTTNLTIKVPDELQTATGSRGASGRQDGGAIIQEALEQFLDAKRRRSL